MSSNEDSGHSFIGLIVTILVVYALCFGVTINGKHYGVVDCNGKDGIKIEK